MLIGRRLWLYRHVASTAAGNRGNEKPGDRSLADVPGGRGAFAPDPATGTEAGPGPTTPRRSAVRRGLPVAREGPCLASVASRVTCATTSRLDASRRSANSPRSGVGCDEGEKEEE